MVGGLGLAAWAASEQVRSRSAETAAHNARDVAHESAMDAEKARRNVERLYMVVQAMWELLQDKVGLTDADLEAKVREIDMRDGQLDGRDATQTALQTCRNCGRALLSGLAHCSWCGAQADGGAFHHAR